MDDEDRGRLFAAHEFFQNASEVARRRGGVALLELSEERAWALAQATWYAMEDLGIVAAPEDPGCQCGDVVLGETLGRPPLSRIWDWNRDDWIQFLTPLGPRPSQQDVADALGCNAQTAARYLHRHGIDLDAVGAPALVAYNGGPAAERGDNGCVESG
jgi:hypothetical protein